VIRFEHITLVLVCIGGTSGCGLKMTPPPTPPATKTAPAIQNAQMPSLQGELDLFLFNESGSTPVSEPTFTVHTPRGTKNPDGSYTFDDASAVIKSAQDGIDVHIRAGHGELNHDTGSARLYAGVEAQAGKMKITLTDINWANDKREAASENPVTVESGDTQLQAASMVLQPDQRLLTLNDVTGTLVQEGLVRP
jgi:hypothetical protein